MPITSTDMNADSAFTNEKWACKRVTSLGMRGCQEMSRGDDSEYHEKVTA